MSEWSGEEMRLRNGGGGVIISFSRKNLYHKLSALIKTTQMLRIKFFYSCGGKHYDHSFLECDAVYSGRYTPKCLSTR
jgi:hypothetical protein